MFQFILKSFKVLHMNSTIFTRLNIFWQLKTNNQEQKGRGVKYILKEATEKSDSLIKQIIAHYN